MCSMLPADTAGRTTCTGEYRPMCTSNIAAILAEKHCQKYTRGFTDCVTEYPDTWHLDCENQRLKLQRCFQSNETVIKVKEKCDPEFSVYEDCITRNPQEMERCTSEFQKFISCADRVAAKST